MSKFQIPIIQKLLGHWLLKFIVKTASENPVLWTGMKDASSENRKQRNQMLKQVQHDVTVRFWPFCHPELVSGSRFWI